MAPLITAFIGLGGVLLGAVTTLLSPALTDRRQTRNEARRWRRDQLATAYEQALRFLLRASNRRSEFEGGQGGAVLSKEHQREWFDDLVEAQVWLRTVARFCEPHQADQVRQTAHYLDQHVSKLVSGERFDTKGFSIWHVLQSCISQVTTSVQIEGVNTPQITLEPDKPSGDVIAIHGADNQYINMTEDRDSDRTQHNIAMGGTIIAAAAASSKQGGEDMRHCPTCGREIDIIPSNIPFK